MVLDVITIVSETTPKAWVAQCRESIKVAQAHAGFPVQIIEAAGVPGDIGIAMRRSLQTARSPYVAWVDDDDFVLPNAFSCLARHLASGERDAVFAREVQLLANGQLRPLATKHHLTAFSRDLAGAVRLSRAFVTDDLHSAVKNGVDELAWVYIRRIWRSAAMRLRASERA